MNGYIEAGYSVVLGTLAIYSAGLVRRERVARRRLGAGSGPPHLPGDAVTASPASPEAPTAETEPPPR